jgi:hypothetical protein
VDRDTLLLGCRVPLALQGRKGCRGLWDHKVPQALKDHKVLLALKVHKVFQVLLGGSFPLLR